MFLWITAVILTGEMITTGRSSAGDEFQCVASDRMTVSMTGDSYHSPKVHIALTYYRDLKC